MLWCLQMVPKFPVTGSRNTEGRPSHSLLLFPELELMLGRAKLPPAITSYPWWEWSAAPWRMTVSGKLGHHWAQLNGISCSVCVSRTDIWWHFWHQAGNTALFCTSCCWTVFSHRNRTKRSLWTERSFWHRCSWIPCVVAILIFLLLSLPFRC